MKLLDFAELPSLALSEGATSPDPGQAGALAWSTSTTAVMRWNGTAWNALGGGGGSSGGQITFSYPGPLAVGAGQARFYVTSAGAVTNVVASVGTAPTGSSVIVDVNKNGSTLFTTQAARPTIAASAFVDTSSVPAVTALAVDDWITVDIDQVGSTVAGSDLTVTIYYS